MSKHIRRVAITPVLKENDDGSWSGFWPGRGPAFSASSKEELLEELQAESDSWINDPDFRAWLKGEIDHLPGMDARPEGWEVESMSGDDYDSLLRGRFDAMG